jgi:hypothetical protein
MYSGLLHGAKIFLTKELRENGKGQHIFMLHDKILNFKTHKTYTKLHQNNPN